MAKKIKLENIVEVGSKTYMKETVLNRFNPSQIDGLRNVNRSILHAIMDDFKGETVRALDLSGKIAAKYHLHKPESIYHGALLMVTERTPLISIGAEESAFSLREGKPASKYTVFTPTKWGEFMYRGKVIAPTIKNYSLSDEIPEFYPSLLPYWAFTNYTNISVGVSTSTLACNPREIFNIMLRLIDDTETPIEELVNLYKGPDIGEGYTVVGHPQSLYTYLNEGYAKYTILANIEITREMVLIKEVPYRSTLLALSTQLSRLNFESFTKGPPERIISNNQNHIMQFRYKLNDGYTLTDMQKELYDKTSLKKTVTSELIGLLPHQEDGGENRLNIVGLRDYLVQSLRFGYNIRQKEIEAKIAEVHETVEHNSLLEKLTRPEVLEWFQPSISEKGLREKQLFERGNKEILGRKIGNYIEIKGGISEQDVKTTFKREGGNHILVNLDYRHTVIGELERLDIELGRLHEQLEPKSIIQYLKDTLMDWADLTECERKSMVLFKDIGTAIETTWEQAENILVEHMISQDAAFNTPVHIIFYNDGTFDYFNPLISEDIPAHMCNDNIRTLIKCTTGDELIILNSTQRFKIRVKSMLTFMKNFNDIASNPDIVFQGVIIHPEDPPEDLTYVMITNLHRVKKINVQHLTQTHQSVKPLPLAIGEYFKYITARPEKEFKGLCVETLTTEGVKRRRLEDISERSINGFATLLTGKFNREAIDVRICDESEEVLLLGVDSEELHQLDSSRLYLRDTLKEVSLGNAKPRHYSYAKQYYTKAGKKVNISEVFTTPTSEVAKYGVIATGDMDYYAVNEVTN